MVFTKNLRPALGLAKGITLNFAIGLVVFTNNLRLHSTYFPRQTDNAIFYFKWSSQNTTSKKVKYFNQHVFIIILICSLCFRT